MRLGNTAKPWDSIESFYRDLARRNTAYRTIADLALQIAGSGYVAAGLCGLTSMSDLIVGPSPAVLDNPHLVIAFDFVRKDFVLTYRDGSPKAWRRHVGVDGAFGIIERFLTRRARWYRKREPGLREGD